MTNAFLRIKRNGKVENIEVEFLTTEERQEIFKDRTPEELLRWIDVVCRELEKLDELLSELEKEGILEKRHENQ